MATDGNGKNSQMGVDEHLKEVVAEFGLEGRTLYLPQMPYGGSLLLAAAIRSIGVEARVTPDTTDHSQELGGKVTSGDECYPQKITVGDFLGLLETGDRDKIAFLMPTANGPCRFGQYMHLIRRTLDDLGYNDVPVITITSNDGYSSIGQYSRDLIRTAWRAVVAQDILMKLLLKTRPYEVEKGATDAVYHESLADVDAALELQHVSHKERLAAIIAALKRSNERFRAVEIGFDASRPLIGIVGEIFCRFNTFANADLIRLIEEAGGECWLSDVSEWVWYVDDEHKRRLVKEHRVVSGESLGRWIRASVQRSDEHALLAPFAEEFVGYEEAHDVREILELSHPYLPYTGALGEMVLSTGKSVYLYRKGADGIIDISPFTCMNGIVTEAIYPVVQRDCDDIPIRTFYFDGTQSDLERDIGIFLELAKTYQRRKKTVRRFPPALQLDAAPQPAAAG
jgi:predicted nucleotide-binding protein (sugar kinase/HSP70/actin superfamily)